MNKSYTPRLDDNQTWAELYRLAGEAWADLDAAANLLEDTKSSVMAQRQAELGDIPVNRAEQIVKASPSWIEHIQVIVEARKKANYAKVNLEAVKMEFMIYNNREANARTEARLL